MFRSRTQLFTHTVCLKFLSFEYCSSYNNQPRCLFDLEALLCGPFWRATLKSLFQSKKIFFMKFQDFVIFSFQITINKYHYDIVFCILELLLVLIFFLSLYACFICSLIKLRLDYVQVSNKRCILRWNAYWRKVITRGSHIFWFGC